MGLTYSFSPLILLRAEGLTGEGTSWRDGTSATPFSKALILFFHPRSRCGTVEDRFPTDVF